jgi:hypothetical protein
MKKSNHRIEEPSKGAASQAQVTGRNGIENTH